jgi:hypothetical protein
MIAAHLSPHSDESRPCAGTAAGPTGSTARMHHATALVAAGLDRIQIGVAARSSVSRVSTMTTGNCKGTTP